MLMILYNYKTERADRVSSMDVESVTKKQKNAPYFEQIL